MRLSTVFVLFTILLPVCFGSFVCAADLHVTADSVALGSDYFQTLSGTHFNFGGGIGNVNFMGLPIGPFLTDTIVQRKADAVINGAPIPLQITALSLESTAPVNVAGSFFDVFVTLDPAQLANDTGMMSILGSRNGGTFMSNLNVFFLADFVPRGGGQDFMVAGHALFMNAGGTWGPVPPPGIVIVPGPDDGSGADQTANLHRGLDPCVSVDGACEVDFFAPAFTDTASLGDESHRVMLAQTPEPGSLLLMAGGLIALSLRFRLRRS